MVFNTIQDNTAYPPKFVVSEIHHRFNEKITYEMAWKDRENYNHRIKIHHAKHMPYFLSNYPICKHQTATLIMITEL